MCPVPWTQQTTQTEGFDMLFPRPNTRWIPEVVFCKILMLWALTAVELRHRPHSESLEAQEDYEAMAAQVAAKQALFSSASWAKGGIINVLATSALLGVWDQPTLQLM